MPQVLAPSVTRTQSIFVWLALVAAACAAYFVPMIERAQYALFDLQLTVLRAHAPIDAYVDPVVIIGIDEATLAAHPEPLALWHRPLARLLDAIVAAKPRAIGLDLELPERSYDFVQTGLDASLLKSLYAASASAPLVAVMGVDASGRAKPLHVPFAAALGAQGVGFAIWEYDRDGVVRRFDERLGAAGEPVATFVGTLARRLGYTPGAGWIDVAAGAAFDYVPAHRLIDRDGSSGRIESPPILTGRVVLIGSVLPHADQHRMAVPLAAWSDSERVPGVIIHAQALRSILGAGLVQPVASPWIAAVIAIAAALWFAFARIGIGVVALAAFLVLAFVLSTGLLLTQRVYLPIAAAGIAALVASALRAGYEAWFNRAQRQRLRRVFAGVVSPNVLMLIERGELDTEIGSGRRDLCVMFGDVRGFTPLTEASEPEAVVALLNRYFERVVACVHRHDGTLDNFRGDGIMCMFGAPRPVAHPCLDGFNAAREMLAEVDRLSAELVAEGLPPIRIGLSLAYGRAVVGRVGAGERNEYTAIGDVANVSARIEGLGPTLGYPLVLDSGVAAALADHAALDDLGEHALKGHSAVRVFGWPARGDSPPPSRIARTPA